MSKDYVLYQKCPACGTRQESTLSAIKAQRLFECTCCGLTLSLRPPQEPQREKTTRQKEAPVI
ncbi:MAG: hypothetical protein R3208_18035 [Ketobacteraceae bacterium]|nr:hypothetical protein [Ketobacteraceae bacterium]